jgi:glycosyltransferase involved in cell wall biosynthesis
MDSEESIRVLFDGWPLVYDPFGPAGIHLQTILAYLPEQIEPVVALPGPPPAWLQLGRFQVLPAPESDYGRLAWEQRDLARVARQVDAPVLHTTSPSAPLLGKYIRIVSPSGWPERGLMTAQQTSVGWQAPQEKQSFLARLRTSLGQGGFARAGAVVWPADVPAPELPVRVVKLPPGVHPNFFPSPDEIVQDGRPVPGSNGHSRSKKGFTKEAAPADRAGLPEGPDLPETYVLYHGPTHPSDLKRLLECWQWASGPVGNDYPLVITGLSRVGKNTLEMMLRDSALEDTVRLQPAATLEGLSAIYRGCSVFFYPALLSPWGCPVRNALACGKPVVAAESRLADAVVGPAAYLAPGDDPRALGAALLTVIVEEEVAEKLTQSARERSSDWDNLSFGRQLLEAYQQLLSG